MSNSSSHDGREFSAMQSLGTFRRGQGGTKADARPSGVPCVRYGDLYTKHGCVIRGFASFVAPERASSYTTLKPGDIVFAGSGETHEDIGKGTAYCGTELAVAGGDTIIFSPRASVDSRFLGYAVNTTDANRYKARYGQGSSVIHIGAAQLAQLRVFAPPHPEQRRIAEILDTVDEAIHKTEQIIAKLQQMKQGLLHDLLTRGVGENGELRDPERHPEQFQDSPLGRIPRDWQIRTVCDLLADVDPAMRSGPFGSSLLKHELATKGVPLLGIDNVHVERFVCEFRRFVSEQKAVELSRYRVRPRDVMITIMGTVGRCAIVPDDIGVALSTKHVWTLTFDESLYSPFLACLQFNYAPWVLRHMSRDEQGGIMSAIRSETLRATPLPVPPRCEQYRIERVLSELNARLQGESSGAAKLRNLKNGLMDALLTGRVRVQPPPGGDS